MRPTRSTVASETEHEADEKPENFVDNHQEYRSSDNHQQHKGRGDERLAPCRPYDARSLGSHLLDEFERVGHSSTF